MRVFLFLSKGGDSLPIAQRIEAEGHKVNFYINDKDKRDVGKGLIAHSSVQEEMVSKEGRFNNAVLKQLL